MQPRLGRRQIVREREDSEDVDNRGVEGGGGKPWGDRRKVVKLENVLKDLESEDEYDGELNESYEVILDILRGKG